MMILVVQLVNFDDFQLANSWSFFSPVLQPLVSIVRGGLLQSNIKTSIKGKRAKMSQDFVVKTSTAFRGGLEAVSTIMESIRNNSFDLINFMKFVYIFLYY